MQNSQGVTFFRNPVLEKQKKKEKERKRETKKPIRNRRATDHFCLDRAVSSVELEPTQPRLASTSVVEDDFKVLILVPLPPKCWLTGRGHHTWFMRC